MCDRNPGFALESWFKFVAMLDTDTFQGEGGFVKQGDSWHLDAKSTVTQLIATGDFYDCDIWLGYDLVGTGGAGRQIAFVIRDLAQPYYYAELFDSGTKRVNIIYDDGTNSNVVATTTTTVGLGPSLLWLRVDGPAQQYTFHSELAPDVNVINGATPITSAAYLFLGILNYAVDIRYLAITKTRPN